MGDITSGLSDELVEAWGREVLGPEFSEHLASPKKEAAIATFRAMVNALWGTAEGHLLLNGALMKAVAKEQ